MKKHVRWKDRRRRCIKFNFLPTTENKPKSISRSIVTRVTWINASSVLRCSLLSVLHSTEGRTDITVRLNLVVSIKLRGKAKKKTGN